MPPLSKRVVFWHSIRVALLAKICHQVRKNLKLAVMNHSISSYKKVVTLIALVLGLAAYRLLAYALDRVICSVMSVRQLNALDEMFLVEENNRPNTTGVILELNTVDYQKIRSWYMNVFSKIMPEGRSRIVQYFGNYYYQKIPDDEFEEMFDKHMIKRVTGVHTKEEMQRVLDEDYAQQWEIYKYPLHRATVFDGFSEDTTYVSIYASHAFSDGVGVSSALKMMDDRNDASTLTPLKRQ